MTNRLLLVTQYFPPASGSGVQRGAKFVKYLLRLGWEVDVVTIDPSTYPWQDPTMRDDVAGARVREASLARVPGIEHRVLRAIPALRRRVAEAVRESKPDVILATAPDFHWVVAARAAASAGIPLVLDYPDPWTVLPPDLMGFRPPTAAKSRLKWAVAPAAERWCTDRASAAVFATEPILEEYSARFPGLASRRVITNGFDTEDFEGVTAEVPNPSERIRISHVGSFGGPRSPVPMARAVRVAADLLEQGAERLEVSLVGAADAGSLVEAERALTPIPLRVVEWLPHRRAIGELLSATVLWLDAMAHLRSASTGKIFEYLYSGRPVFALAHPESPAAALVERFHAGRVVNDMDPEANGSALAALISGMEGGGVERRDEQGLQTYDRRRLTDELSELLLSVTRTPATQPRSHW